jgi:hypothetical protein
MKKLLLLLGLFTPFNLAFSQQKNDQSLLYLTVVDSLSGQGLARATIEINKLHYYSTSISGSVNMDKSFFSGESRLRFSCTGYRPLVLKTGINTLPDTIKLARSLTLLQEVKISPYKPQQVTWGYFKTNHVRYINSSPNAEFAQYFPNDAKFKGSITNVEFEVNDKQHALGKPFGVEVLSRSEDSIFPDTALVTDSIIVYNPEKKRHVGVDLSKYHISVPENGFFIVFQPLNESYYEKGVFAENNFDGWNYATKTPAINIFLKNKDSYAVECCDPVYPKLTGPYCMASSNRKEFIEFVQTDQWIVYQQGINFAMKVTLTPD